MEASLKQFILIFPEIMVVKKYLILLHVFPPKSAAILDVRSVTPVS